MKHYFKFLLSTAILCACTSVLANDSIPPRIHLNNGKYQKVQIGSSWTLNEPKAVSDNETDSADIYVEVSWSALGPVNTNKRGVYWLFILAEDLSKNSVWDTVFYTVDDFIPPVINLNTPDQICVQQYSTYNRVAATATDNYYDSVLVVLLGSDVDVNVKGLYTDSYKATDGSGNTAYKNRIVEVSDCNNSGISEVPVKPFRIYPNPVSEILYWNARVYNSYASMVLYNSEGKQFINQPLTSVGECNLSALAEGIYQLKLFDGIQWYSQKILIRR